jgi:hypothetical protein
MYSILIYVYTVFFSTAREEIIAGPAVHCVVAVAAEQGVVALPAVHRVVALSTWWKDKIR